MLVMAPPCSLLIGAFGSTAAIGLVDGAVSQRAARWFGLSAAPMLRQQKMMRSPTSATQHCTLWSCSPSVGKRKPC
ncbi:hypothetical protein PGIGA_G00240710 [Pangasianodon gigas]|uniref:Uncharacterized protein n=1 Tax=Pangasianodon gigas TaxID=30993 RepID=A0ACC5WNM7_PANGG|nr:hypothetical protein [Pangasianodon gigas]